MRIAVVGAGVTGLAVTEELARRGHDVTCFEAATPMAARSVGDTRIFRLAHRRPELVAWAMRARRLWDHWSADAGERLVGTEGTVVSGDVVPWAAAMSAAGAPHAITDDPPGLPAHEPAGPFLLDPAGGTIQAAAAGRYLLGRLGERVVAGTPVTSVAADGGTARLTTAAGDAQTFDSVVVTAGAGTAALAAGVGIGVPTTLEHHARFTFPLRDPGASPPCWLDDAEAWRPGVTSYQHLAGPGLWAIGCGLPAEEVRWERGADAATAHSREVVTRYVAEYVTGAEPTVVGTVYCDSEGLGDGLSSARVGPVLVLWGDNLFKMAPVIGQVAADAAVDLSLPDELVAVRH
jgi:sarcosine oxidase